MGSISVQEVPEEMGAGTFCHMVTTNTKKGVRVLEHHEFVDEKWVQRSPDSHLIITVTASISKEAYEQFGLEPPRGGW